MPEKADHAGQREHKMKYHTYLLPFIDNIIRTIISFFHKIGPYTSKQAVLKVLVLFIFVFIFFVLPRQACQLSFVQDYL